MVGGKAAKRLGLEILGWTLVVLGLAALVLPGPGLLMLFAGLYVLSQQYEWAERKVEPVKVAAFRAAAEGVQTWPRILASVAGVLVMVAIGITWGLRPDVPGWWPIAEHWWLPGGWGTWEEFFEVLTWGQLGLHSKPCGLLNVDGYFDRLLSFIEHAIDEGFVRREYQAMISVSTSPAALLDKLASYQPPVVEKWIDRASA